MSDKKDGLLMGDGLLEEHDGPMLRHGLQGLHGHDIDLPMHKSDWPDRERLGVRFGEFTRGE